MRAWLIGTLLLAGCTTEYTRPIPSYEEQTRECYEQGGKVTTTNDPSILRCMFKDLNGNYY